MARLEVRLLDEILGARGVARQMQRAAVDGVQFRKQIMLDCGPVGPNRRAHDWEDNPVSQVEVPGGRLATLKRDVGGAGPGLPQTAAFKPQGG